MHLMNWIALWASTPKRSIPTTDASLEKKIFLQQSHIVWGLCSTEEPFSLPTQQPILRFLTLPRFILQDFFFLLLSLWIKLRTSAKQWISQKLGITQKVQLYWCCRVLYSLCKRTVTVVSSVLKLQWSPSRNDVLVIACWRQGKCTPS